MDPAVRFDDAAALARVYPRQARSPFNLTGHPALAVMSGLSRSSLPLSLQLVGRAFDEVTLLRVGACYERATNWTTYRPPAHASGDVEGKPTELSASTAAIA
jgi:aspartyl-tRNA(Asn)/glutamyl-tRNA(Gln) amidotransferase subunit A